MGTSDKVELSVRCSSTSVEVGKLTTGRNALYPENMCTLPPLSRILFMNMNVGYYLLLCPRKLAFDSSTGIITAISCSRGRKVSLMLLQTLAGLAIMSLLLDSPEWAKLGLGQIQTVVMFAENFGWCAFNAVVTCEIWTVSHEVATMLNSLVEIENSLLRHGMRIHWIFQYPMAIVICLHGHMLTMNIFEIESNYSRSDTPQPSFSSLVEEKSLAYKSISNVMLCLIEYENQVTNFANSAFMLLGTILLIMSRSLQNLSGKVDGNDEVITLFRQFTKLCQHIKQCMGNNVHWIVLLLLPYYAHQVGDIFVSSWSTKLLICYYILRLSIMLAISAQAHAQFHSLTKALAAMIEDRTNSWDTNIRSLRYLKANMLIVDVIDRNGLGMRGRGLTITYSFFGSVMGCILAYSIAVSQLRQISSEA